MIHGDSSRPASLSKTPAARSILGAAFVAARLAVLVGGGGAVVLAGCGSSDDGQPFPEFEGRWAVDVDTSAVTCPQMEIGMQAISPWSNPPTAPGELLGIVTLEAGVLTDLVETGGECYFHYKVDPKFAEAHVANPDPYTNGPPRCVMPLRRADGSSLVLESSMTQPLTFQLQKPEPGSAQIAVITGAANATVNIAEGGGSDITTYEGCTFAAQAKLHKIAKP